MKVRIFMNTSALEVLANHGPDYYFSPWSLQFQVITKFNENESAPEDALFVGELELDLPTRDKAVELAAKGIRAEEAFLSAECQKRLNKLLSLTWEG